MSKDVSFEIKIVYDDRCALPGFTMGFGFSALIYNYSTNLYILFDTGGNGDVLFSNLSKFDIISTLITKVVISHNHYDHSGGLNMVYMKNNEIEIYVPSINELIFEQRYPKSKIIGVQDSIEIDKNILSSGQFNTHSIAEQFIILRLSDEQLFLLVGCAHPGLDHFIECARKLGPIKGIIGGFHGFNKLSYLEGIDFIGACHCTQHMKRIQQQYGNSFKQLCVGSTLKF
jgi:7,8-dihydropterin-6-yl-methyl-4-(beta-D-ribofuranosyl)aminobenzene 5'-phosphate synthase